MELVVVGTKTCGPCKVLTNLLKEEETPFTYIDAENNKDFCEKHSIMSTPTTLLFENNFLDSYSLTTVTGYDDDKEEQIFALVDLL